MYNILCFTKGISKTAIRSAKAIAAYTKYKYYNKENYFFLIGKIKKWDKRGAVLVQEVKNILKHFLPPPADSFYREMGHLHQTILELNSGINVQQNGAEYEFANMMEKLNDFYYNSNLGDAHVILKVHIFHLSF